MQEQAPVKGDIWRIHNPEHTTGIIPPTRRVIFNDQEIEVHNTNNFYLHFHIYQKWQKEIPPENTLEEVLPNHYEKMHYPMLFSALNARRPNLYAKLLEIHEVQLTEERARNKFRQGESLDYGERDLLFRSALHPIQEEPESLLFYSKAYDALCEISKEIVPDFDPTDFCR